VAGSEANYSPLSSVSVKNGGDMLPLPITPSESIAYLSTRTALYILLFKNKIISLTGNNESVKYGCSVKFQSFRCLIRKKNTTMFTGLISLHIKLSCKLYTNTNLLFFKINVCFILQ
jgi:hypothetical protein